MLICGSPFSRTQPVSPLIHILEMTEPFSPEVVLCLPQTALWGQSQGQKSDPFLNLSELGTFVLRNFLTVKNEYF